MTLSLSLSLSLSFPFTLLGLKPVDRVECKIEIADTKWRPLVVEVGALGSLSGISKIAASVISPLADRKVSVYCLSTNLDDYVLVSILNLSLFPGHSQFSCNVTCSLGVAWHRYETISITIRSMFVQINHI